MILDRRQVLAAGLAFAACAPVARLRAQTPGAMRRPPFTLGVASGYPTSSAVTLWTRLAPEPLSPDGGLPPATVAVDWEVARDPRLRDVVRRGIGYATAEWAHSLHVEVGGLDPDRPYWYRFSALGWQSPIGRTWTAPSIDSARRQLRIAVASCQNYEHGYFTAYRALCAAEPDLVVHVGDYIYEGGNGPQPVRSHDSAEVHTLGDYRVRHALYRLDADLQAAHAAAPWLCTWDDHEVDNDYAGDISEQDDDPVAFRARRLAAMRAYYEHLPLPRAAVPLGAGMRLYQQRSFGPLANFFLLDGRQYRTVQACSTPERRGARSVEDCAELDDPARTMLGDRQETWLRSRLQGSGSRWHLFAQGVVMTHLDEEAGAARRYWSDSWNGYPAARRRFLDALVATKAANPVVLSGDIHAFAAARLDAVPERPDSGVVGHELVTTSISSRGPGEGMLQALAAINPNVVYGTARSRGYLQVDLTQDALTAHFVGVDAERHDIATATSLQKLTIAAGGSFS